MLVGALTTGAVLLLCTYCAAFRWAVNTGVVLGLDLLPSGFRTPGPTWPFTVAAGLLVAVAILILLRLQSPSLRAGALLSAATVAVLGLIAALVTAHFADNLVEDQPAWLRVATFLSQSEALVVFAAIMTLLATGAVSRNAADDNSAHLPPERPESTGHSPATSQEIRSTSP